MSERCPFYVALEDAEVQTEHMWLKVTKGERRPWFDIAVMMLPKLWVRE